MSPEILQAAFDAVADTAETEILKVVNALTEALADGVLANGVKVEQSVEVDPTSFEVTEDGFAVDLGVETTITPVAVVTQDIVAGLAGLKILNDIRHQGLDLGSDWDFGLGA